MLKTTEVTQIFFCDLCGDEVSEIVRGPNPKNLTAWHLSKSMFYGPHRERVDVCQACHGKLDEFLERLAMGDIIQQPEAQQQINYQGKGKKHGRKKK